MAPSGEPASLPRAPDAVTVRGHGAAGPWQLRSRLLVGGDGSNSIIARELRGTTPPRQDRILAVRAYFDDVGGPAAQADICLCSDSFPGYYWLFPAGGGQANVGVGMLVSTYPQAGRNLRELMLRLIAADPVMRHRLREARMDGKVLGCPLTTYDPRLPLAGRRRPSGHPAPAPCTSKIGGTAGPAATSREFAGWAAGVGRSLTEFTCQLIRARTFGETWTTGIPR